MEPSGTPISKKLALSAAVLVGIAAVALIYYRLGRSTYESHRRQQEAFGKDISEIQAVDPKLIRYRQIEQIPTGFAAPTAIAIDAKGRLVVGGDKAVKILDRGGAISIPVGAEPTCLAGDEDGNIYIGLSDHIEVFSAEGKRTAAWPSPGQRTDITSIAACDDDVFIADVGHARVLRYDRSGKLASAEQFKPIEGITIFSRHLDVAIAPDRVLWVSDPGRHQLKPFKRTGQPARGAWGVGGKKLENFAGCCNPSDFAILPTGSIVTSEKGAARVKVYSIDGQFECVVADTTVLGHTLESADLATDADGRVYVLDTATKCVRVFERKEDGR